jgi:hypothetical protein
MNGRCCRSVLLAVLAFSCLASVSAIDAPSSKPKQTIGKYAKLFLKPSKVESDVDAYAFVIPVRSPPPPLFCLVLWLH